MAAHSLAELAYSTVEFVLGRRWVWKLSRFFYLHARREGSLDFDANGERALQKALASRSARTSRPLVAFDVGANHGQWTLSLLTAVRAAAAPRARIVLFEPAPAVRAGLPSSLTPYGKYAEIVIEAFAVADAPGTAKLIFTDIVSGDHHLETNDFPFEGESIEVDVVTIDNYCAAHGIDRIDILKIDAEGFDPKVIAGARKLLAKGRIDVVQFEYSALFIRSRAYLYDIFEIAREVGYSVALLTNRGFEIHSAWHFDLERFYGSTYLLVHDRAQALMRSQVVAYGPDNTHAQT